MNKFKAVACLSAVIWCGSAAMAGAQSLDLSAYKGKVVYLDFWASWCGPCKLSFPWMMKMQEKYGKDLVIITVDVDADKTKGDGFLKSVNSHLTTLYDPKSKLATDYRVKSMPTAFLIDRKGATRFTHSGFEDKDEAAYEQQIEGLVKEK